MRDPVEDPVAHDRKADEDGGRKVPRTGQMERGEQDAPHAHQQQAVRIGITVEGQRGDLRGSGRDGHPLPAKQQKDRPQQIRQLWRSHEPPERGSRRRPLQRQPHGVVADEHEAKCRTLRRVPTHRLAAGRSPISERDGRYAALVRRPSRSSRSAWSQWSTSRP